MIWAVSCVFPSQMHHSHSPYVEKDHTRREASRFRLHWLGLLSDRTDATERRHDSRAHGRCQRHADLPRIPVDAEVHLGPFVRHLRFDYLGFAAGCRKGRQITDIPRVSQLLRTFRWAELGQVDTTRPETGVCERLRRQDVESRGRWAEGDECPGCKSGGKVGYVPLTSSTAIAGSST